MKEYQFIIKRGISDQNERQLILNEDFIKFENKDYIHDSFTTIQKEEITAYRYGIKWISYFGLDFQIYIQYSNNKQIKINFATYFGRHKSKYLKLYRDIAYKMWDLYFQDIANNYLQKFNEGIEFQIADVYFNQNGVFFKEGIINTKNIEIPWKNVRTFNYQSYFAIADSEKLDSVNKQISYLEDWNVPVLHSVIRTILNYHGIESHE
jgi:hypothetical protein